MLSTLQNIKQGYLWAGPRGPPSGVLGTSYYPAAYLLLASACRAYHL